MTMSTNVNYIVSRLLEAEADETEQWAYRGVDFKQFVAVRNTGFLYPSISFMRSPDDFPPDMQYLHDLPEGPLIWFSNDEHVARKYGEVLLRFPWPVDAQETYSDEEFVITHKIPASAVQVVTDDSECWVPVLSARLKRRGQTHFILDPEQGEAEVEEAEKSQARYIVGTLLVEADEPDDEEVKRYLELVKAKPHFRRFSREELRRYLATRPPAQPEPPSEPHQIVGEALEDEPQDVRAEVDRLLPTKTYTLAGNSMIHAPGLIRMAQNEWRNGRKKQKTWALGVIHAWQGLPEEVYLAILNGKVEIETQGDSAVITVKQY